MNRYNLKHAYDDLQNGKQHRALKAFNLATDLEFGKTQPAPYIEMSKILIDMDQASNSEPLLAHAFSLLPEVKALKDRAGTENYMQQAFIANYDVSDVSAVACSTVWVLVLSIYRNLYLFLRTFVFQEGAAMSDTDDFKELKKEYHESAGQILDASIKHFSKKKFKNEQLVEKLVEFKKGIFDTIEDNSGDASQGDTEFDEDDQDDHLDSKPDFDKMVDDEDEDEE